MLLNVSVATTAAVELGLSWVKDVEKSTHSERIVHVGGTSFPECFGFTTEAVLSQL